MCLSLYQILFQLQLFLPLCVKITCSPPQHLYSQEGKQYVQMFWACVISSELFLPSHSMFHLQHPTCTRWRCLSCLRCRLSSSSFLCRRFCISAGATAVLGSSSLLETDDVCSVLLSLSPSSSSLKLSTTNSESL